MERAKAALGERDEFQVFISRMITRLESHMAKRKEEVRFVGTIM